MIALLLVGCLVSADPIGPDFAWNGRTLPAVSPTANLPGFADYAQRTGWDVADSVSRFGSIPWGAGGRLAVHLEIPRAARGTVLLVHGYMDHSGLLAAFERHLLAEGWAVCAPDLPGHGLSTGRRGDIDSFGVYGSALRAVLDSMAIWSVPRPWVAVGHSTGGAALLAEASRGESRIARVALVAPLVRIHAASWIRAGLPLASWFSTGIDRQTKRRSTHDSAWHERMSRDPLEVRRLPYSWVRQALRWESQVESLPIDPSSRWLLVQGDRDDVVDGPVGEATLKRVLPNLRVVAIPGGMHHLLNEGNPWRSRTWSSLDFFLADSG